MTMERSLVDRLRESLYFARHLVIRLATQKLPVDLQLQFTDYRRCTSRDDTVKWEYDLAQAVLKVATPDGSSQEMWQRADCPLCGAEYKMSIGMERHLNATHHQSPCPVLEIVKVLARNDWHARGVWELGSYRENTDVLFGSEKRSV